MQRWKTHPAIAAPRGRQAHRLRRARDQCERPAVLPKTVFPGGALVGCDAGYLNAARIKGSHAAIKRGMLAARRRVRRARRRPRARRAHRLPRGLRGRLAPRRAQRRAQLQAVARPGLLSGALLRGIDQLVLRGRAPWTLHRHAARPREAAARRRVPPIDYPKPDGKLTFDRSRRCSSPTPTTRRTSRRT